MNFETDIDALKAFLNGDPDCEALSQNEYVADLYDCEKPMTVDLILSDKAVEIVAAAYLEYDEEQDGWYMGERVEDAETVKAAFEAAMKNA